MNKNYIFQFGKFKGKPLDQVPLTYLDWLVGQEWVNDETLHTVTGYLLEPAIRRELDSELEQEEPEREC